MRRFNGDSLKLILEYLGFILERLILLEFLAKDLRLFTVKIKGPKKS